MYINNKLEARIAAEIANDYFPGEEYTADDFLHSYTTNVWFPPHTEYKNQALREMVREIRALRSRRQ